MPKQLIFLFFIFLLSLGNMLVAKEKGPNSSVRIICKQAYRIPDLEELKTIEKLLNRSLKKNKKQQSLYIDGNWANWGIMAKEQIIKNKTYLSFMESDLSTCKGKGSYIFNFQAKHQIILQAPHSFYDKYTGKIVELLFLNDDYFAAFWNSSHRYNKNILFQTGSADNFYKTKGADKTNSADLSKAWQSYFMSFSKVIAQHYKNAFIVQIHGFSAKKRRSSRGKRADIILSQGSQFTQPFLYRLKDCLVNRLVNQTIYIYPLDIKELGATRNSVAQQLRWLDFYNFIHIEINQSLRKKLVKDKQLREHFSQCLVELSHAKV